MVVRIGVESVDKTWFYPYSKFCCWYLLCRKILNLLISSTKILGKLCGWKAGIILHGWNLNWKYWIRGWCNLFKSRKALVFLIISMVVTRFSFLVTSYTVLLDHFCIITCSSACYCLFYSYLSNKLWVVRWILEFRTRDVSIVQERYCVFSHSLFSECTLSCEAAVYPFPPGWTCNHWSGQKNLIELLWWIFCTL